MYRLISVVALAIICRAVPEPDVNDASNRIANGEFSTNRQFPFAVSIQLANNNQNVATRGHRCGGALITLQHVLTAASCMFEWNTDGSRIPITTANYRVFTGAHLLSNDSSADMVRTIAQTIVHPNYQGIPSYFNDIAIVVLTTAFPSSVAIPLSLPASNYDPADFTDCIMVGWGASTYGATVTASVEQKFAKKYIYNQQMCTSLYNTQSAAPNILPSMICATSYDMISFGCNGDEGNALVCGNNLTGILALHGNCGPSQYPELYTRVSNYTEWIKPYTGSAATFTSGISVLSFLILVQMALASLYS